MIALSERSLIEEVIEARQNRDIAKKAKAEAENDVLRAEAKLVEFMTEKGVKSTAKYEGLGMAILEKPELFARCNKPDQEALFGYLTEIGRGDMIKPSVHHKSLSSFVGEVLEQGGELPEFIQYGFKQTVAIRKA